MQSILQTLTVSTVHLRTQLVGIVASFLCFWYPSSIVRQSRHQGQLLASAQQPLVLSKKSLYAEEFVYDEDTILITTPPNRCECI